MKKIVLALGLIGLLAGCASHNNGMGGTSDQYNQSNDQFNNNATHGTGAETGTNYNQGQNTMPQSQ